MASVKNTHHLQDTKKMDFLKKGYKDFLNFFSGASAYVWSSLINKKSLSFPKTKHKSPKLKCAQNSTTPKLNNTETQQPQNLTTPKLNDPKTWQS